MEGGKNNQKTVTELNHRENLCATNPKSLKYKHKRALACSGLAL